MTRAATVNVAAHDIPTPVTELGEIIAGGI